MIPNLHTVNFQPYTIPKFPTRIGLGSAEAFHKGSADRRDRPVERWAIEGSAKDRPDPFSKDRADRRDRPMAEMGLVGLVAHHAQEQCRQRPMGW